ncbi:MAG: plastocyanin/azurin family copper-binding protein [Chloroflexota bacterium]
MSRRLVSRRLVSLLGTAGLVWAALALLPAAVLAGDPCFHRFDNRPAPSSGATSQVALGDCVFTPTVTRVAVGATVTWSNTSFQTHEIVGSNMTWGTHDKLLQPDDSIGWTFPTAGVYGYSCMIHPGMTGVVVVGESTTEPVETAATGARTVASTDPETDGTATPAIVAGAGIGGLALGLAVAALLRRRGETPAS